MIATAYINPPAGCFNPPLSRWNVALSLRCSGDGRSGAKICAHAPQAWPQSWTPCAKSSSAAEHKPLPPRNWIQMSRVSVSSIYTLCIFTTGQMIRMLERSEENAGAIFSGYSEETRSLSGVRHWCHRLFSKNLSELLSGAASHILPLIPESVFLHDSWWRGESENSIVRTGQKWETCRLEQEGNNTYALDAQPPLQISFNLFEVEH